MSPARYFPRRGADRAKASWRVRSSGLDEYVEFGADFEVTDVVAKIWRTDPILAGSQDDTFGVAAGPPHSDILISSSNIRIRPQVPRLSNPPSKDTRKVMAEIHSLEIEHGGYRILAGEPLRAHLRSDPRLTSTGVAEIFRRSYGEIVSRNEAGDPNEDFPADGFFNVFLGLVVPKTAASTELTLYNREPLLIIDQEIQRFPLFRNRSTSTDEPLDLYFVVPPVEALSVDSQEPVQGGSIQVELKVKHVDSTP